MHSVHICHSKADINKPINQLPTSRIIIKNTINLANPINYKKEIIRVIIFSALNLLSISSFIYAPLFLI